MITAYPLTWPKMFPRTMRRENGAFKTSLAAALKNVQDSLRRFAEDSGKKIKELTISSNVTLGVQHPGDPGVAVWFSWDGLQVCIPIDRYAKVEANLQAIHHILEARRTELRHGGLTIVRATFTGFKALPAPQGKDWPDILQCKRDSPLETVRAQYRRLSSIHHPDKLGGSEKLMSEINQAWEAAQRDLQ